MLKDLITRTINFLPRSAPRQWLMNTCAQVFSAERQILPRSQSKLLPQSFSGPIKSINRRAKKPFSAVKVQTRQTDQFSKRQSAAGKAASRLKCSANSLAQEEKVLTDSPSQDAIKKKTSPKPGKVAREKAGKAKAAPKKQDSSTSPEETSLLALDPLTKQRKKLRLKLHRTSKKVYEELHKEDRKIELKEVESAIEHKFHEPKLLSLVLVHFGSMKHESGLEDAEDAQGSQLALMWIGDAILQFLITEQLIARYATPNNFRLHTARVHLVNRKSCGMRARKLGLDNHLIVGGALKAPVSDSMMGEVFEALIGVIYLDGGMPAASSFFSKQFEFPKELKDVYKKE